MKFYVTITSKLVENLLVAVIICLILSIGTFVVGKIKEVDNVLVKQQIVSLIKKGDFYNEYQPLLDTSNHATFAYEAFIRTNLERNPLVLFEKAKSFGMKYELDTASILNAIKEFPTSYFKQHLLFVNIFPSTIIHPEFPVFLKKLVYYSSTLIGRIVFELNETKEEETLWEQPIFVNRIELLKSNGFHIALDDIHIDESLFWKISKLSPEYIKLDRSYAVNLPSKKNQNNIKNLLSKTDKNMLVVLEGIETAEEINIAIQLKIPLLQGYYISKPHQLDKAVKILINDN